MVLIVLVAERQTVNLEMCKKKCSILMSLQKRPFCFLEKAVENIHTVAVYFAFPVIPKFGKPKTLCMLCGFLASGKGVTRHLSSFTKYFCCGQKTQGDKIVQVGIQVSQKQERQITFSYKYSFLYFCVLLSKNSASRAYIYTRWLFSSQTTQM